MKLSVDKTVDISRISPGEFAILPGTFVIIVRYVNKPWARYLFQMRKQLSGVVCFVDDDFAAIFLDSSLPFRYRSKSLFLHLIHKEFLSEICSQLWVSTPYLARKYALDDSAVLAPLPLTEDTAITTTVTYFYAGSAAHAKELRWLKSLVERLQHDLKYTTFVTFGDREVGRMFSGIPRVLILRPMPWDTFVSSMPVIRCDIGLAPLIDSEVNRARSYTKFYDITRLGGAGVYADTAPYSEFIRQGVDGLLCDGEKDGWFYAIKKLAETPRLRALILNNARERVYGLKRSCPQDLPVNGSPRARL